MAARRSTGSAGDTGVGKDCKQYAGGGPYNVSLGPDGTYATPTCARRVVMLVAGDLTLKNAGGVSRVITGLPAGYAHDCDVSEITPSVACLVYW